MCDGTIINLLNIVTLRVLLNGDVALFADLYIYIKRIDIILKAVWLMLLPVSDVVIYY